MVSNNKLIVKIIYLFYVYKILYLQIILIYTCIVSIILHNTVLVNLINLICGY